jgi:type II secretory pathway component PulK
MLAKLKDFLLRERTLGNRALPSKRKRRRNRQRGIALVAVMIAISVTLVITNEFGTSTTIDITAAANYRDQMRSHFLARAAANLAELVIRVQQRIDNVQQLRDSGIRITDFADQVLLAFCGTAEEVQQAIGLSANDTKGLGADVGTCGISGPITTEDDKINLNCANGTDTVAKTLKATLDALILFPAYDPIFQDADADGYRRDRPTQSAAIVDYIDADTIHVRDRGTSEDYGYENLKDFYKAKNNYLDTVGEAHLIRGIDDRFWTLFGPSFTVYGGCKTNISSLNNAQLIAAILYLSAKNPQDPIIQDPLRLFALANVVAKAKEFGESFSKVEDFANFVKDPTSSIGVLAGQSGTFAGSAAGSAIANGSLSTLTNGQKLGMELDLTKLKQIASAGPRRTYRVEAYGEIDRKQRMPDGSPVFPPIRTTITGVWDTKVVPQNVRKPPVPKGAWVFLRED